MNGAIPAYPLQWPTGWKRTAPELRTRARFGKASRARAGGGWDYGRQLTINEAVERVRAELQRMRIASDDLVISSNLELRLDGLPRSAQREPADSGAAVYWRERQGDVPRCMAIDRYDRVADNLAAIAATLEAMRAIERHGGAAILERAFSGFTAIEDQSRPWHVELGVPAHASTDQVRTAYRRMRSVAHPDKDGGTAEHFRRVEDAWAAFCKERGIDG